MRIRERNQAVGGDESHARETVLARFLQAVSIGVVEHLAGDVGAVEGRVRHDSHRRGGFTRQGPAREGMHGLRAIDELAFTDASADREQEHHSVLPVGPKLRLLQ